LDWKGSQLQGQRSVPEGVGKEQWRGKGKERRLEMAEEMIGMEEARAILLRGLSPLSTERVALGEVGGRYLASEVLADLDLPPFDRARMDGYALRAASVEGARPERPIRLREIGIVAAGEQYEGQVGPGEAVRIMTGAPVPEGADSVERIEVIRVDRDEIELLAPVPAGRNVTPRGLEVAAGARVVDQGERVTPAVAAVLATFGQSIVTTYRSPRVAIFSTGDELVPVEVSPGVGQIRDSNQFALAEYLEEAGARIVRRGTLPDHRSQIRESLESAMSDADVVLLSGGVSMGDFDLVKPALLDLGADILIEKVAMHPGKPTVFARHGETLFFGLPGNPVSVAVAFFLFVRPVLLRLQGARSLDLPRLEAFCTRAVKGAPPRRSHQPGSLRLTGGRVEVEPLPWSGSGDLVGFMRATALLIVPEDRASVEAGELLETILLPSFVTSADFPKKGEERAAYGEAGSTRTDPSR
jgi:molybdopterin molybdotransferase